ncbi:MAG: GGDEF domain-containing protein [Gammaproteobacteria bacterium]|nr:GGDEF domain-containing protein [Gammaproteobacteria bacterium]
MSQDQSSDADRWRNQLQEVEKELDDKSRDLEFIAKLTLSTFTRVTKVFDSSGKQYKSHLTNIEKAVGNGINITALDRAVCDLTDELAGKSPENTIPDPVSASSQVCALLVSEILYQLLQNISLPVDLNNKIESLKQNLEEGISSGDWGKMLELVSDIATDLRLKINNERLDTEAFLKQVTGRLQDLDSFIQGSEENRRESILRGKDLDVAVKLEMKDLQNSVDEADEIGSLKKVIQQRLQVIENHLTSFRGAEDSRHDRDTHLVESLVARLNELEQETVSLRERVNMERLQAQMDPLTGIPNRLGYIERITQEFARWKRFGNPLTLVVCDIDFFKRINDNYGHVAGDKALKSIAKTLSGKIRETDYIARYGGEEFVLIMPGADMQQAQGVAEKLRMTIESLAFHFKGEPVSITISSGISSFKKGDTVEGVFDRADKGLYQAKEGGRNKVVCVN